MKITKKNWLALLAVVALLGTLVCSMAISVAAAGGETNVNKFAFSVTEVQPGDTFTVTFGTAAMKVQVFTLAMDFDNSMFEVTKVNTKSPSLKYMGITYDEELEEDVEAEVTFGCTAFSTVDEMNASGHMGMSFVHTEDREYLEKTTLIKITFKVKEGASGTTTMSFYESSAGTDQCLDTKDNPSGTQTLTIAPSTPAHTCSLTHVPEVKATCIAGGNIEYWYCTDEECGKYYSDENGVNEITDKTSVKTDININNHVGSEFSGGFFPNYDGTHYELIGCDSCRNTKRTETSTCSGGTATCTEKAKCSDCGEEYGELAEHSFNTKDSGSQAFPADCTNPAKNYVQCDNCSAVSTTKTVEVGGALGHGMTNGFRYSSNNNGTHTKYCADCNTAIEGEINEPCSGGTANCAMQAICSTCNTAYGEKNPSVHYNGGNNGYYKDNGDGTHSFICGHCSQPVEGKTNETHDKNGQIYHNGNCLVPEAVQCSKCKAIVEYSTKPNVHPANPVYKDNGDGTHTYYYPCCDAKIETKEHNYTTGTTEHICICGAVETFTLTVMDMPAAYSGTGATEKTFTVPYGTNILDYINKQIDLGNVDMSNQTVNDTIQIGVFAFDGTWTNISAGWSVVKEDSIVSGDTKIVVSVEYTGWRRASEDSTWGYENRGHKVVGWYEIDGNWYYFFKTEESSYSFRAEGFSRVPYNTALGHAPNADDLAYYNANKDTSKYTDAESAVYYFGRDGKLQRVTDIVVDGDTERYAVDGVVAWHVGLVEVYGEYYYFVGDVNGGGNKAAEGDVWVTRTNRIAALEQGSCYNFKDGKLSGISGISNGKYYENSKLMLGNGLTKIGEKYIYVRSAGQLAKGQYYISAGSELASGMYQIDEDGFIIDPKPSNVNGIVDGYYYKNGKIFYAGLIEIDGDIYYVNSSGKVVTGTYYVTKTNGLEGYEAGDKLIFGEDGKMETVKNGIVEENGTLYYYEKNHVQYGAGVVKLNDEEGKTFYIYVRSNGELATGEYWPTTTNDYLARGKYDWGTDGKYYPAD